MRKLFKSFLTWCLIVLSVLVLVAISIITIITSFVLSISYTWTAFAVAIALLMLSWNYLTTSASELEMSFLIWRTMQSLKVDYHAEANPRVVLIAIDLKRKGKL
jgi:hypothetical protein